MTSDGRTAILAARAMVLPKTILAHIPANSAPQRRNRGNHPSKTKGAEAKRAGNRASAALGMPQPGDALGLGRWPPDLRHPSPAKSLIYINAGLVF